MSFPITGAEQYVDAEGRLTTAGQIVFQDMQSRITDLEAKLTAIAAVTGPTGGATTDAEARTAIDAIIAGAG